VLIASVLCSAGLHTQWGHTCMHNSKSAVCMTRPHAEDFGVCRLLAS
jgi:hypothetical protein